MPFPFAFFKSMEMRPFTPAWPTQVFVFLSFRERNYSPLAGCRSRYFFVTAESEAILGEFFLSPLITVGRLIEDPVLWPTSELVLLFEKFWSSFQAVATERCVMSLLS